MNEHLDRYEILEQIGQGGFALVYRARDSELERLVALKELRPGLLADPEWVQQFKREARAIARLDHRQIVTVFDVLESGPRLFIVMQLVDGPSLDKVLVAQGPLPWPQVLEIITAVAEGLAYAHSQGVLHRDLKPANILLDRRRGPLLSDFGLAKLAGEASTNMSASGSVVGTPHYIAPEVWEGQGSTPQADIYALGCIVYELVTGQKLFQGASPPAVMLAHFSPPPFPAQWPAGVPSGLADVLRTALAAAPAVRYASATDLAAALTRLGQEQTPSPPRSFPYGTRSAVASSLPPALLPTHPTPFIGRSEELADLAARLTDPACRLLTLVAPGGMGKSRLSIEAARQLIHSPAGAALFPQGAYFVALAPLSSADHVLPTIATVLNFTFYGEVEPKQQVLDYLREKALLLLLDNFEHLLAPPNSPPLGGIKGGPGEAEAADLLTDLLAEAPGLKILVTSREGLNLQEEWLYPLQGLAVPPVSAISPPSNSQNPLISPPLGGIKGGLSTPTPAVGEGVESYSAVSLFVQSARRARPTFSLAGEAEAVARICRLVEGMPLGLELAAAWVKVLPCAKIVTEIESSLDFLSSTYRNVPARQRSIRAVFEQAWQRLTAAEQAVLARLSVFRGGFRRKAAQAGATLPLLAGLVDKSLLSRTEEGRYQIHELVRQFAAEKLAGQTSKVFAQRTFEVSVTRDRHSAYFLTFLQEREAALTGQGQQAALAEIQAEVENVRTAWSWAAEQGRAESLDRALDSLYHFYELRSQFQEGEEAFRHAAAHLAATGGQPPPPDPGLSEGPSAKIQNRLLARQGAFCVQLGHYELAKGLLQNSLALARRWAAQVEVAFCLNFLGDLSSWQEDYLEAEALYGESLTANQAVGYQLGMAQALERLGWLTSDHLTSKNYFQQSLALMKNIENPSGMASALNLLGLITFSLGQYRESEQYYQASLALAKEIGNRLIIAQALGGLSLVAWGEGRLNEAKHLMEESLAVCRETGHQLEINQRLPLLGHITNSMGRYEESFSHFQEGLKLAKQFHTSLVSWMLGGLGQAAVGLGNFQEARSYLLEALEIAKRTLDTLMAMVVWATLLQEEADRPVAGAVSTQKPPAPQAQKQQAVAILSLVVNQPNIWQIFKDQAARLLTQLEAELPAELFAAAAARGRASTVEAMVAEILGQ